MRNVRLHGSVLLFLALAACNAGPGGSRGGPPLKPIANPSGVVAAELAFARAARERGQWTAFAQYAASDAVMFVPAAVNAQTWLKGRANPAEPVKWQAHQIWSSCDGSLAVAKGAWQQPDGRQGYFTTIWQRQADGGLKWVLDQGDALTEPLSEPEMVGAQVADCRSTVQVPAPSVSTSTQGGGASRDRTLAYSWEVAPDLSRRLAVTMVEDGKVNEVLTSAVASPEK